jgi:protein disulfide-isomerase A1
MESGLPLAYIFAETADERAELVEKLRDLARKHKGKLNFATIDAAQFGQHAANLNLEVGKWPAFAIHDVAKNAKFPHISTGSDLTAKGMIKWANDFIAGKLKPSIKSEDVPENQEGPVTIVVAKNYDEIVLDDEKDVLVEFYAPWCGHCKALAPKYDELGALYFGKSSFGDKVTIAKVDATANDVPDEIQGFPTIKLYPAGKKDAPVEYKGDRTIDDLIKFVRDNGTHGIDGNASKEKVKKETKKEAKKETKKETKKDAKKAAKDSNADKAKSKAEKKSSSKSSSSEKVEKSESHDEHDEL